MGFSRHGRGNLCPYLTANYQGVRSRHSDIPDRLSGLAHPRYHRALFLAVAFRPGRVPHVARPQYRDVLADDADRGAIAELCYFCRSTRAPHLCAQREWSLASMLVAETWPAHLRGRVIS